jgi:hypothetical protein
MKGKDGAPSRGGALYHAFVFIPTVVVCSWSIL